MESLKQKKEEFKAYLRVLPKSPQEQKEMFQKISDFIARNRQDMKPFILKELKNRIRFILELPEDAF